MVEAKTFFVIGIAVIAIAILAFVGSKFSSIADNTPIYDDFQHGLDLSLWTITEEHHSTNGGPNDNERCGGYNNQAQNQVTLYNRSFITTRIPYYVCGDNTCSGTQTGFKTPTELYYADTMPLSCPTFNNPSLAQTEACRTTSCSECRNVAIDSHCSQSQRITSSDGANIHTVCYCGTHTVYNSVGCGGYTFKQSWYGKQNYFNLYHDALIPATASDQMNYITVGWGTMTLLQRTQDKVSGDVCNNNQETNSIVETTKKFTSENIKILYSYDGYSCNTEGSCTNIHPGQIWFGDTAMPISYNQKSDSRQYAGTSYSKVGVLEIKRYDDTDLTKYKIFVDGIEQGTGQNIYPASIKIQGNIQISEFRYEPYFSCAIDYNTEVVVRDSFNSGSNISILTLTYTPTKFCPQDLGVLIYSDKGLTNELGSITAKIANGGIVTVPQGQLYSVQYATKYVNNMNEKCGVGQFYDIPTRTCVQTAFQQTPDSKTFKCDVDSDCLLPPNCEDITATCPDKLCHYNSGVCSQQQISNYVQVMKTLQLQAPIVVQINSGQNQISFTNSKEVAGYMFSSTMPEVLKNQCPTSSGNAVKGTGCYRTHVTWGDYDFLISDGETKNISKAISVTYHMSGNPAYVGSRSKTVRDNTCVDTSTGCKRCVSQSFDLNYEFLYAATDSCNSRIDWQNDFSINFNNVFDIVPLQYTEQSDLNSNNQLKIAVQNNMFALNNGGYRYKISKGITDLYSPSQTKNVEIPSGKSYEYLDLPTDTLGTATVEVTPYFIIADNIEYISDQQIVLGYYVKKDFNCAVDGCLYGKCQVTGQCTTVVQIAENIPKNCSASCPGGSCINDTCYQKVLIPSNSTLGLWIAILVLVIIIILIIIGFNMHK